MTALQQTSFTGQQAFQAQLSAMGETLEMVPAVMSVDTDFFSRIYDVAFGEKGNKDLIEQNKQDAIATMKEDEQKKDNIQNAVETVLENAQKERLEKIYRLNGYEFSEMALDETIDEIIQDKDAFGKKHDLTGEETELALMHALAMDSMPPEERDAYLDKISESAPNVAKAIGKDADENTVEERENKNSKTMTATDVKKASAVDSVSDFKPQSEITKMYNIKASSAENNSQELALNDTPQVTAPDPFELAM